MYKTSTICPPPFPTDRVKIPANSDVRGYAAVVAELDRGAREDARDTVRPVRGGK